MTYSLVCKEIYRDRLKEILTVCGMEQAKSKGDICIVEKALFEKTQLEKDASYALTLVIDPENLEEVERRLCMLMGIDGADSGLQDNHIVGKIDDKFALIEYDQIHYFSAASNDVYFHSDRTYACRHKLYELETGLCTKGFVRINKSEIVNIKKVREIMPWFNSRLVLVLESDVELVVTKSYTKRFKEFIGF